MKKFNRTIVLGLVILFLVASVTIGLGANETKLLKIIPNVKVSCIDIDGFSHTWVQRNKITNDKSQQTNINNQL